MVLVVLVLAVVALAGCGGSSKSSSTSTSAAAKTATTGGTSSVSAGQAQREIRKSRRELEKHDTAVRECLQKGGVSTLGKLGIQVSSQPPKGMTRAQYEAMVNKCGGHIENAVLRQAFTKFAACMRENGVRFPAPNTSGTGPVFSAKGVNTTSPTYRKAVTKCSSVLRTALRASAGAHGSAGATGSASQVKPPPVIRPKVKVPPAIAHDLQKFTACMREHGVAGFPEPEGASFNLSHVHIDTKSAQYKAAEKKCEPILQAAFK